MDFDLDKYFQRIRQVIGTEPANEREKNILDVLNSIPPGKQILPGGSELAEPLPLIGLDTARPFYSDKSVVVTPMTTGKIEGIKKIVDPVTVTGPAYQYLTAGWDFSYGNDYTLYTSNQDGTELYGIMIWPNSGLSFQLCDQYDTPLTPTGLLLTSGVFWSLNMGGLPIAVLNDSIEAVLKTDTPDPQSFGLLLLRKLI